MKKLILAGATAVALSAPAYAELEGDLSLTYHSEYQYRGLTDSIFGGEDTFSAGLNATYGLNGNFSLVGSANVNTLANNGRDHNNYSLGIRWQGECCSLEFGYRYQDLQFGGVGGAANELNTDELYLQLGTKCPLTGADVNLLWVRDVDTLDGDYVELSLTKSFDLCENYSVYVTVGAAAAFDYWTTADGMNHGFVNVSLPVQVTDNLVLTPFVSYTTGFSALENEVAKVVGIPVDEDDNITFGVKATVKF